MIVCIPDILSAEECRGLKVELDSVKFADGSMTAGWHAREMKNNLQLLSGTNYDCAEKIVRAALARNAIFQMAVRTRYMPPVIFNRYEVGMAYGHHIDDPVMVISGDLTRAVRSDVSFTLFLSAPDSYQGGELSIDTGGAEQSFKPPQGSIVIYSASTLHRVKLVSAGVRLAAIGWIQSEVRDPAQRTILFELDMARRSVFAKEGKSATFDLVSKSHANLLRLWAEL